MAYFMAVRRVRKTMKTCNNNWPPDWESNLRPPICEAGMPTINCNNKHKSKDEGKKSSCLNCVSCMKIIHAKCFKIDQKLSINRCCHSQM
jgi:hypothetical protein